MAATSRHHVSVRGNYLAGSSVLSAAIGSVAEADDLI